MPDRPLLTIAIPTFNRANLLAITLAAIQQQRLEAKMSDVEVVVLDNQSDDATPAVVASQSMSLAPIVSIRRPENIGSDRNIAEAFDVAQGRWVWILGDDDVPLPGTIASLVAQLKQFSPGLVYLRPYGYQNNFLEENPGGAAGFNIVATPEQFLRVVGAHITFISSIVVDRSLLSGLSAQSFVGSNLVQVEIYLNAAAVSENFLISRGYQVAAKRNNSGGYDFTEVFVERLAAILERHVQAGLSRRTVNALNAAMLQRYFPQAVWKLRRQRQPLDVARARFRRQFSGNWRYWIWVDPILTMPHSLALGYGFAATFLGRAFSGDWRRGVYFARSYFRTRPERRSR